MENSRTTDENSEQSENPALDFHRRMLAIAAEVPQEAPEDFPSDDSDAPSVQEKILARAAKIPQEELDKFPPDFSENLDYYLYGMPKKSPGPSDDAQSVERNTPMTTTSEKDELAIGNDKQSAKPEDGSGPPAFVKRLIKMSENMSQEDRDKFPPDYSENLDHYLYGTPKKTP